jgi:eukaryotic-like serine/threonine-protein kinase
VIRNSEGDVPFFVGDLRRIVTKCLEKRQENRYATVDALILDIRAYLNHYPIAIRKRDIGYLGKKYFIRNQKMVAAAGLALILLLGTIVFYTLQLKAQTNAAQFEAKKAQQISALLTDVFMASDPNTGNGDTLTARQLLNQGVANLEKDLGDQPELLASMLMKISPIYLNLGQYENGKQLAKRALSINQREFDPPHEQLAFSHVLMGKVFYHLAHYDSAMVSVLEGIVQYKALGQMETNAMADALLELGGNYYDNAQYIRADSIFRLAYSIHQKNLQAPHVDLAFDLHMIGTNQRKLGNFEEAKSLLMASLEMKMQLFAEPHLEIAYTYNHIGSLYQNMGDVKGSIPFIEKSLSQRKTILGDNHVETLASQANLARAFTQLNDFDAALPLYQEALSAAHALFGESHHYVAALTGSIGNVHLQKKDFTQAEDMFKKAIRLNETLLPAGDIRRAPSLMGLGKTYMEKGQPAMAYDKFRNALDIRLAVLPEVHQQVAQSQQALGECSLALGNYSTAISELEKALDTFSKSPDNTEIERSQLIRSLSTACDLANLKVKADFYQNLLTQNR